MNVDACSVLSAWFKDRCFAEIACKCIGSAEIARKGVAQKVWRKGLTGLDRARGPEGSLPGPEIELCPSGPLVRRNSADARHDPAQDPHLNYSHEIIEPMKCGPSFALLAIVVLVGCDRIVRTGAIIDQYSRAECIPVTNGSGSPARTWNYTLQTREVNRIQVDGRAVPGGLVSVKYLSDGKDEVVANAGDYIYPADVRFDHASGHLYVKAAGVTAAFSNPQTWLFDYDLLRRRSIQRVRVDPNVLPPECPVVLPKT